MSAPVTADQKRWCSTSTFECKRPSTLPRSFARVYARNTFSSLRDGCHAKGEQYSRDQSAWGLSGGLSPGAVSADLCDALRRGEYTVFVCMRASYASSAPVAAPSKRQNGGVSSPTS